MATGDATSFEAVAGGGRVTFDLEGMESAGISAFASGKACTINASVVSGYTGTTLGTSKTRTLRTKFKSAVSNASTVVNDTFTEASATALASHSPDTNTTGNSWVESNGTWEVNTAGYVTGTGSSPGGPGWVATIDCGAADTDITDVIRLINGFTAPGIVVRYSDNSNMWKISLQENTEKVILIKREAGSDTIVAEYLTAGIATAVDYTLRVVTSGTSLKVYWGGSEVISYTSSFNQTATKHGIVSSTTGNRHITWTCVTGNGATITLDTEEPLYLGETYTVDLDDAAFNDGANDSNAVSGGAVTNSSALAYPVAVCGIVSKLPARFTSAFYIDVYAAAGAFNGYLADYGIEAVEVTVTDSAAHAETVTATAMSLVTNEQAYGWQSQYPLFRVGPFDPADFTDGVASIVAVAYPAVGDASSKRTATTKYCYIDQADAYDTQIANVDCSGTITLAGGGLSAGVSKLDRIVGDTSGAVAFVNQAYAGGATSLSVSYSSGTFTSGEALTIKDSYADTTTATATMSGAPAWNFTDGGGSVGSGGTAYQTIIGACNACAAANGSSKGSWSEVRLLDGIWTHEQTTAEACNTSDGPIKITRHSTSTKSAVLIVRGSGLAINNLWYHDLTIKPLYGENYYLRLASANASQGMDGGATHSIVLDDCDIIGVGRTTAGYFGGFYTTSTVLQSWASFTLTESNLANIVQVIRDSTIGPISEDLMKSGTGNRFVVNVNCELDATGTAYHSDAFQFYTNPTAAVANCAMHNCLITGASHQNAPFGGGTSAVDSVTSFAMTNCVQEADGTTDLAQFGDNPWDSIFIYHSISMDGTLFRNDGGNFALTNGFFRRNVFGSVSVESSPDVPDAGWIDNHFVGAGTTYGFDITTGGSTATLFVDYANDDYRAATGGTLSATGWTETLTPYDASGVAATGYIGAMASPAPTVSDVSPASIAKGATADITLTGTGFIDGISASSNYAAAFTVNTTTFNSATEVVVNVTGGSGTAGAYLDAITLTNPDGQTVDAPLTLTETGGFDLSWSPVRNGSLGVMPLRGYPL